MNKNLMLTAEIAEKQSTLSFNMLFNDINVNRLYIKSTVDKAI